MSYYQEILLPFDAKYYSFIIKDKSYNSNHDIAWSFNFLLSTTGGDGVGICTFLTSLSNNTNLIGVCSACEIQPGHFLGTALSGDKTVYILSGGEIKPIKPFSVLKIAFDSTGLYALSTTTRDGVSAHEVVQNALIVRGCNDDVLINQSLDSTGFSFNNTNQIVRCLFSNVEQKLTISYRNISSTDFFTLTSVQLPYRIVNESNIDNLRVGLSYCTPISTLTPSSSKMLLYNTTIDGVEKNNDIFTFTYTALS